MKYKLLALDFDGTIFTSDSRIPDDVINSISKFIENGGNVVIATGRSFNSIKPYLIEMGLTEGKVICHQGASIFDISTGKCIRSKHVDREKAVKIIKRLEMIEHVTPLILYNDVPYVSKRDSRVEAFENYVRIKAQIIDMDLSKFIATSDIDFPKAFVLCDGKEWSDYIIENYSDLFKDYFTFNKADERLLELVDVSASKGYALEEIAQTHFILRDEIIAIGDADNDRSMLEYAGLGLAVENGMESLKSVADAIIPSNDESGVSWAIEKYIFS